MGTTPTLPNTQRVQSRFTTDSPLAMHGLNSRNSRNRLNRGSNEYEHEKMSDNDNGSIQMKQLRIQLIPPQQQQPDDDQHQQLEYHQQHSNNYNNNSNDHNHLYNNLCTNNVNIDSQQQPESHQEHNNHPLQQQLQPQLSTNTNNLNLVHLTTARMTIYSQTYNSFRQSFTSDNSQSTIYLQPPQFILRSPILVYLINKLIQQFFDLTQFLGIVAIKIFRASLYLGFALIIINIGVLMFADTVQCMYEINGGVVELQKWLVMDTVVSVAIVILLGINRWLVERYNVRVRRWKYMQNVLHVVQCSWIGLYAIKFFVLNSLGSCQFFTYTYRHKDQPQTTTQCPHILNIYLISVIIFNYISILFLCVFVVEHLV